MPLPTYTMNDWIRRGQLAKALGIPTPTVKYYTALGLFPVQKKTDHGQYLYNLDEIRRRFDRIQEMKMKRLTIQEIQDRFKIELVLSD